MPPRLLLSELTREEVRALAPETLVVLPTAAIEQHGPHLPIQTDTAICEAIARRAAELASAEIRVLVAPTVCYGSSHHHRPYPGVLSLRSDTFLAVLRDLCESLILSGFTRIVLLNGHGGNDAAIRQVALDVATQHPVAIAAASYWTIARPALLADERARTLAALPGHAGAFETACMLALRPDLVTPDRLPVRPAVPPVVAEPPAFIQRHRALHALDGFTDNPAQATRELGEHLLGLMSRQVADFLIQFARS